MYLTRPFLDVIELSFKCRKAGMNAVPRLGQDWGHQDWGQVPDLAYTEKVRALVAPRL